MQALLLLATSITMVFLLGLQSLNVNRGYKGMAAATSLGIGLCNYYILRQIPNSNLQPIALWAYLAGGPVGIVLSMYSHDWLEKKFKPQTSNSK